MENENPKNQLVDKLKEANNVLVTVSTNPTVDQLSAAIGLTLFLTKLKKHATTVFSGHVPSTIDFLKPEETIETNTDSLRDFIISLDKAKADKIRYKVEDTMVKIFITPYRTSINDADLVFSQGDFNVDVVVALGIQKREDIDQAIMAHGRILHDATVATVNITESSDIGTLNWTDPKASSLCEMMVAVTDLLKANSLDGQMATALLTGIVAETERFSNEKTSSNTMNASAKLMNAGANQQLVATKLRPPEDEQPMSSDKPQNPEGGDSGEDTPKDATLDDDGSLRINHHSSIPEADETQQAAAPIMQQPPADSLPAPWTPDSQEQPEPVADPTSFDVRTGQDTSGGQGVAQQPQIQQDNRRILDTPPESPQQSDDLFGLTPNKEDSTSGQAGSKLVTEPPQFGGQLSAAADDSSNETNPLNLPPISTPLLSHSRVEENPDREPPKPLESGPPEPYTVFEPEPGKQEQAAPQAPAPLPRPADPRPNFPINLPQAADSPNLNLPSPPLTPTPQQQPLETIPSKPAQTGHAFVDMGNKTLDDIEKNVDSHHQDSKSKLPEQFVLSLDGTTLSGLEEKVGSPHAKMPKANEPNPIEDKVDYHKEAANHVVKAMSGTTLDKIEEKVGSPHVHEKAQVLPSGADKKDDALQLSYESHESEPAEKTEETVVAESAPVENTKSTDTKVEAVQPEKAPLKVPEQASIQTESKQPEESKPEPKPVTPVSKDKLDPASDKAKQEEARDAVMRAINAGGDGRSALPPLESIGTTGAVEVNHEASTKNQQQVAPPAVPPPLQPAPHKGPSPNISIDPVDGTFVPLPPQLMPNSDELPQDATASAESEAGAPPEVPPPMMPPVPTPVGSLRPN